MSDQSVVRSSRLPDLELDEDGRPRAPVVFVDLDNAEAELAAAARTAVATVGLATAPARYPHVRDALTLTLTTANDPAPGEVFVEDLDAARAEITAAVARGPRAAMTLNGLLRLTSTLPTPAGRTAESHAYSMLLAGAEFAAWRHSRPIKHDPGPREPAVLVERRDNCLHVTLNRPGRHNAFGRHVRDGLVDAFDLALADPSIETIVLDGNGASFCSGGDLDEFGSSPDVTTAHLIRLDSSVAARVDQCRHRTVVHMHGACIGAGIEIPAFAGRVVAARSTAIRLPELEMGLVPGAGGTVSITRRIGRWRTAWLALTGRTIAADLAYTWGLVDAVSE
jgi:hypothetical protein